MKEKPKKVWLILGYRPAKNLKEYDYETDPRCYNLPGFKPMTDYEYSTHNDRIKVFVNKEDAIDFLLSSPDVILFFEYNSDWIDVLFIYIIF